MIWNLVLEKNKPAPDRDLADSRLSERIRGLVFSPGDERILWVDYVGTVAVRNPDLHEGKSCIQDRKNTRAFNQYESTNTTRRCY
ncbi:hypothetical protein F4824DRAFT_467716 [Ustulina deusta]|nr:hypothetical protein F4824DRAFT_467716 [Ustulina deusta]